MRKSGVSLALILSASIMTVQVQAQTLKENTGAGHPTESVTVTGAGFADLEAIDVYFDTVDTRLEVSSSTGGFTDTLTIPATTTPGIHYITAVGRRSGDASQVPFNVTTGWTESGFGGASKNWNPYENTISPYNVSTLGLLWSAPSLSEGSSPVVSGGYVYIASLIPYGVQALKTSNGAVQWTALTSSSFGATPAVTGGVVYIGSNQGVMYALNATTGAVKWSTAAVSGNFSSAVVVNGIVYAGNINGILYAFAAATGKLLWSYTVDVGTFGGNGIQGAPAVADGVVYIASYNGYVYALNATTGALQWKYQTGGPIVDAVSLGNGLLYVGVDTTGDVLAIITKFNGAGTVKWSFPANLSFGTPAVAGNIVYAGSDAEVLYALNATTGVVLWEARTSSIINSEPTVANGVVYVGDDGGVLYAFDANYGGLYWSAELGSPLATRAVISDGVVYASNQVDPPVFAAETFAFNLNAGTSIVRKPHAPPISALHPNYRLTVQR